MMRPKCISLWIVTTIMCLTMYPKVRSAIVPYNENVTERVDAPSFHYEPYLPHPNEVLPIQPVLIYPKTRQLKSEASKLNVDSEIIYVRLLKRKNYRPKLRGGADEKYEAPKELKVNDIFYVKALANGQFSHHRLKVYRLPEFYAISVFRKDERM